MRTARVLLAFLLTPLLAALVFATGQPLAVGLTRAAVNVPAEVDVWHLLGGGLLMAAPIAYAIALVLGVPAYFMLKTFGQLKFSVVSLAGTAAGLCTGYWAFWIYPAQVLLCGLGGLVAAASFWIGVCWPPDKPLKPTRSARGLAPIR